MWFSEHTGSKWRRKIGLAIFDSLPQITWPSDDLFEEVIDALAWFRKAGFERLMWEEIRWDDDKLSGMFHMLSRLLGRKENCGRPRATTTRRQVSEY
jgi:hypothetical protein